MGAVVQIGDARDANAGLKGMLDLVAEDMGAVNRIILDKAISDVELIPTLAHHLIDFGRQAAPADVDHCGRQADRCQG